MRYKYHLVGQPRAEYDRRKRVWYNVKDRWDPDLAHEVCGMMVTAADEMVREHNGWNIEKAVEYAKSGEPICMVRFESDHLISQEILHDQNYRLSANSVYGKLWTTNWFFSEKKYIPIEEFMPDHSDREMR